MSRNLQGFYGMQPKCFKGGFKGVKAILPAILNSLHSP